MKKYLLFPVVLLLTVLTVAAQAPLGSYWFDSDDAPGATVALPAASGTIELDASTVGSGIHRVFFQARGADGTLSNIRSAHFVSPLSFEGARAYVYVDGEPFTNVSVDEGTTAFEIDAKNLSQGLHTMSVLTVCADGSASGMKESVCMRAPAADELRSMRCYYTIDNDSTMHAEGRFSGNVMIADIDAAALSDGLHSINFMLASADGLVTQLHKAWFMKLPLGGVNIRSYRYWVNHDVDNGHSVTVKDAPNPYTLAALLPMKTYPLRSSSYHFDVEDGVPTVYPKNDFNILFTDNRGYFTVQSTSYHDSANGQPVTDITPFGGTSRMVSDIGKNEIRWFSVAAEAGDTLAISAGSGCMMEMYTPDGELLMQASGAGSVKGTGTHTMQTGTHYLAVHDPSNSSRSVRVNLLHLDKFALIDYTPDKFASKNFVIVDLRGNGFESLKSVSLRGAGTLHADTIAVRDWSYARAVFRFDEKTLSAGDYKLDLTFADDTGDDYVLTRPVTIEAAEEGDLLVAVNPRNNTITNPRRISVTITNESNYGLWYVPFCVATTNRTAPMAFDFMLLGSKENDPVYYDTDNLLGLGVDGRYIPIIIPYMGPRQKYVYDFVVERIVDNDFDFYAWCGIPWSKEAEESGHTPAKAVAIVPDDRSNFNFHSYNAFHGLMDFGSHFRGPAGYAAGAMNQSLNLSDALVNSSSNADYERKQACEEAYPGFGELVGDAMPHYPNSNGMTPVAVAGSLGDLNGGSAVGDSYGDLAENSNPLPDATRVQFPSSIDPNDIIGYTSPAGSEYIGKAVRTLGYMIEFENDPEFATASALTVEVDNKLDGKVFDLGSFTPVSLRLGKKTVTFDGTAKSTVATMDMRPEINGIAQVTVAFDETTGTLRLNIQSLSPYTMEPTDDIMQGFLPVNTDGNGIGEFCYNIDLRAGLTDGASVENSATIVFDTNEAIATPVWRNVLDYTEPTSQVLGAETSDGKNYTVKVSGTDSGSGFWRYNLYVRNEGEMSWKLAKSLVEEETVVYASDEELHNPTFMTVAVDRAGNVERNEISVGILGDLDISGKVDSNDIVLLTGYYVGRGVNIALSLADLNGDGKIDSQDMVGIRRIYVNSAVRGVRSRKIKSDR